MATTRRARAARRKPPSAARQQSVRLAKAAARRGRLQVTVTTPDGAALATRGLGSWLAKAAPASARGEVTIALVSDARMRTLNRSFRGKDYATDVLSFPTQGASQGDVPAEARAYLGDIVIATGVAQRQADDIGHSIATELKTLALHGLLHLLGYDHETDDGEMARVEASLRKKAGLAHGLTARRQP